MDPERPGLHEELEWFDPRPSGDGWVCIPAQENAVVFDLGTCFLVNIYKWVNWDTGERKEFDGHFHGVINCNNRELFTFLFLDDFARGCLTTASTFRGYLSTALDSWLDGAWHSRFRAKVLYEKILDYKIQDRKESASRRLQKLFLNSFFDWVSLQFQHSDFDHKASFTCHCHDSVSGPLKVFLLYDNACHGVKYALNRYPESLKETQWLVDKLHWANHTLCSPMSDSGAWPFMCPVNTQVPSSTFLSLSFLD